MSFNELVVPFDAVNRQQLLSDWHWLIDQEKWAIVRWLRPPSTHPILLTAAGNAFVQTLATGAVHFLDTSLGTVTQVSTCSAGFQALLTDQRFVDQYFAADLVRSLRQAGLVLGRGQIYGLKVPLLVGGQLASDNVVIADIQVHFSTLGQLHRKVRKVAAGKPDKNLPARPTHR